MNARGFTPKHAQTGLRLFVHLSEVDEQRTKDWERSHGYRGIVTDTETNQRWHVFGASCGLVACHCDAIVYEVKE